jgi:hypothetical protein
MNNRLDQRPRGELDEPELRPREAEQWNPRPVASPSQRGRQQRETADTARMTHGDLQRNPTTEAVADQVDAVQRERVEQIDASAGEEARVVGGADRLVRVAELVSRVGRPLPVGLLLHVA